MLHNSKMARNATGHLILMCKHAGEYSFILECTVAVKELSLKLVPGEKSKYCTYLKNVSSAVIVSLRLRSNLGDFSRFCMLYFFEKTTIDTFTLTYNTVYCSFLVCCLRPNVSDKF